MISIILPQNPRLPFQGKGTEARRKRRAWVTMSVAEGDLRCAAGEGVTSTRGSGVIDRIDSAARKATQLPTLGIYTKSANPRAFSPPRRTAGDSHRPAGWQCDA